MARWGGRTAAGFSARFLPLKRGQYFAASITTHINLIGLLCAVTSGCKFQPVIVISSDPLRVKQRTDKKHASESQWQRLIRNVGPGEKSRYIAAPCSLMSIMRPRILNPCLKSVSTLYILIYSFGMKIGVQYYY
jgi:hypothetical protein